MALAYTKNVVHAGGVDVNPTLNREGQATVAILPGSVIAFGATGAELVSAPTNGKIIYLADKNYLQAKGIADELAVGDLVVGIHPLPGMFLNVRAAAGTYKEGDPVTIANGQIVAGTSNVFAYVEEDEQITVTDGGLVRVVFK